MERDICINRKNFDITPHSTAKIGQHNLCRNHHIIVSTPTYRERLSLNATFAVMILLSRLLRMESSIRCPTCRVSSCYTP